MMQDNEEDADDDNNLPDWAWVHEAGGFQDEPMPNLKDCYHHRHLLHYLPS